jgi:2-oxoglutarate dehydrogenase E2 component (dihydrolipoamide succinyltransferase)
MSTEITVPTLGESVSEATVAKWTKSQGDAVETDETLLVLETDKVSLEVYAPTSGVLSEIRAETGAEVEVGAVLGVIDGDASAAKSKKDGGGKAPVNEETKAAPIAAAPAPAPAAENGGEGLALSPAVRKLMDENNIDPSAITGSGKNGRLTKGDVLAYLENREAASAEPAPAPAQDTTEAPTAVAGPREERVRMSRLRQRIAERLKEAQNTAAMLTTFNEVDMTNLLATRTQYREAFEKKHGVRLGFMSFFAKAAIVGLKEIPAVNGEIDGNEIIYKNYYNIGIAVGSPQGLVVPVVRDADHLSFAGFEGALSEFALKARDGKLSMDDLSGGTFTISNGGIYGSLMSTPILNAPQSAILGMHKTQPRPVAVGDKVEIRPMMYLALSYDHRIIDGREAVTFLVRVKECIEDPQRILLDM